MPGKVWGVITYPFLNFNDVSIPKPKSLIMDNQFHPTFYNGCSYLSMLEFKLSHVSKRDPRLSVVMMLNRPLMTFTMKVLNSMVDLREIHDGFTNILILLKYQRIKG